MDVESSPSVRNPRRQRRAGRRDFGTIKVDGTTTTPRFSAVWWEAGRQRRKRGFRTRGDAEAFLARVRTELADGTREIGVSFAEEVTIEHA
jgi:hypothetical protein